MEKLDHDWLTKGLIDFEYKKYVLLAYFKSVKESFTKVELYPYLADLVWHYRNLQVVKENKSLMKDSFPQELTAQRIKNLEINYRKIIADDDVMLELEQVMEYALPLFKLSLDEGSCIYDYVESQCEIIPVGISSLYKNEGYLFVSQPPEKETNIYRYQMTLYEQSHHTMRSIQTNHISVVKKNLSTTYESIKQSLTKKFIELPNPCTYLVVSKFNFPYQQTLMPIAKRLLMKEIGR
ncbi:MAG: hypothetical protein JST43_02300 [Bacteroidetes bacterium]|nr:hypothetical protein [Bacteroidota bacterium]MBS1541193.1 hypothetical protein [Bacteroidota bacterium]